MILLLASSGEAQQLVWPQEPILGEPAPAILLMDHEKLRFFKPTGRLVTTKRLGPLTLEIREAEAKPSKSTTTVPASISVRLRNRLVAAATGYRLGGDFTNNGVQLEGWDGSSFCTFVRWRLEFAGERLRLIEKKSLVQPECTIQPD